VVDQQSGKQQAQVDQRKLESFAGQFVRILTPQGMTVIAKHHAQ
jgi:hypothetical protein